MLRGIIKKNHFLKHFAPFFSVDGSWSEWRSWSVCTRSCGEGTQTRSRTCSNPRPAHGGRRCLGSPAEKRSCNTNGCPGKLRPVSKVVLLPCRTKLIELNSTLARQQRNVWNQVELLPCSTTTKTETNKQTTEQALRCYTSRYCRAELNS